MLRDSFDLPPEIFKKMSVLKMQDSDLNRLMEAADANATSEMKFDSVTREQQRRQNEPFGLSYSSKSSRSSTTSLNSLSSEEYDFTRVKPTITSNLRYKIARNEPIKSHYYREHIKIFGKPPFILGTRSNGSSTNGFSWKKSSIDS